MPMTDAQLSVLTTVNAAVNAIPYNAIAGAHEPADAWIDVPVPGNSWECRDYVLAKADRLRAAGFDPRMLTVITLYCEPEPPPEGPREYHAVLAVDFEDLTMVLDSRYSRPYLWSECPYDYQWHLRQIPGTNTFGPIDGA